MQYQKGMTIRDVLQRAFDDLYVMESKINDAYNKMGDVSEDEMNRLLEQVGEWQEILEQRGFYEIDAVIERTAQGLGLMDIGLERDVSEPSGQRTKVLLTKLLLEKADHIAIRRTNKLFRCRTYSLVAKLFAKLRECIHSNLS